MSLFSGGYSSPFVGLYVSDPWERAPIGLFSRAGEEEPSEVGSREFGSIKHLEEHRGQQGNGGAHHPVVQFECSADIRELFLDIGA